jgi:hypothetical protein
MRGPDDFSSCEEELVGYYNINEMVLDGWLLVNKEIIMGSVLYRMAPAFCVDCRYFGSNEKPDYW